MKSAQRISAEITALAAPLDSLIDSFLLDRQARRLAPGSLRFYRQKLARLQAYCEAEGLETMGQLTADALRRFLLGLEPDHNAGGVHGCYRALRAFLKWFELGFEPERWRNPIARVRAPRQPQKLLEPADLADIRRTVRKCPATFARDRVCTALLIRHDLALLDIVSRDVRTTFIAQVDKLPPHVALAASRLLKLMPVSIAVRRVGLDCFVQDLVLWLCHVVSVEYILLEFAGRSNRGDPHIVTSSRRKRPQS